MKSLKDYRLLLKKIHEIVKQLKLTTLDASNIQSQIDAANASIQQQNDAITAAQAVIATEQATLVTLNAELKQVTLVNDLEALASGDVTTINDLLTQDAANNPLGISLAVTAPAPTPEPAPTPSESPAEPAA
jgi:uncharacterized protein YPO0396